MSETGPIPQADELPGIPAPEQSRQLVGHQELRKNLSRQLEADKLPGAILFHGPKGIGKATAAFDFAREVLAKTGDEPMERVSEQIAQGVHPNLFVLRRKTRDSGTGFYANIRVEEVRALQQRMRQTRGRAGHRVCVIDAIDDANTSTANALLKILEEPPEDTMFIAVSHRPGALLPTIHSRCQGHAMRGLSSEYVSEVVHQVLPDVSMEDPASAITLADGRPRRAIEALLLDNIAVLEQLHTWLGDPAGQPNGTHLAIADTIGRTKGAEADFAREVLVTWLANEVRNAARAGMRNRLASATRLWDKAQAAITEADIYNLDMRQMLISLFDGVLLHVRNQSPHAGG